MKSAYVADLVADQTITSFFLVADKETRPTREGKPFLHLELRDRTGSIEARMWENFEEVAPTLGRDAFVKVQARVETYKGRLQLAIEKLRRAQPEEIDLEDYFPRTKKDVEELYRQLTGYVAEVRNPWLRRLLESVVGDRDIVPKLKRAPAAKSMHHAYLGGLLEHVVSLCGVCRAVVAQYPEVDADLLLAGVILHDIGKIEELAYEYGVDFTTEGQLLGHIVMELELVGKKIDALEGFPAELRTLVLHMLASHHGRYEFGSPRLPMFPEALLLHYLDDLDSKMATMREAIASDQGEGEWTAWNRALERRFLRLEKFLRDEGTSGGAPSPGQARLPRKARSAGEERS